MTLNSPEQSAYKQAHEAADTDAERSSIHHTLGKGVNQAAPGNHTHDEFEHTHDDLAPIDHEHPDYENAIFDEIPAGHVVGIKQGTTGPNAPVVTNVTGAWGYSHIDGNHAGGSVYEDDYIYSFGYNDDTIRKQWIYGGSGNPTQTQVADLSAHLSDIRGMCKTSTHWFILAFNAAGTTLKIFKFDLNWALVSSISLAGPPTSPSGLVYNAGEDRFVYTYRGAGNNIFFRKVNPSTGATAGSTDSGVVDPYTGADPYYRIVLFGKFDYGADLLAERYLCITSRLGSNDNEVYAFSNAFVREAADEWPSRPNYQLKAMAWVDDLDPANYAPHFRQLTDGSVIIYTEDMDDMARQYAGVAYNADETQKSLIGGITTFTPDKRTYVKVTYNSKPSHVDHFDTFMKRTAVGAPDNLWWRQEETPNLLSGSLIKYYKGFDGASENNPAVSTWPSENPGLITMGGGQFYIDGDGDVYSRQVTNENNVQAHASLSAAYADPSSTLFSVVLLNTLDWNGPVLSSNPVDNFTITANGIEIPADAEGFYFIIGSVVYQANATGTRQAILRIGAANIDDTRVSTLAATAGPTGLQTSTIKYLVGGDIIKLCSWQNSGADRNITFATLKIVRLSLA